MKTQGGFLSAFIILFYTTFAHADGHDYVDVTSLPDKALKLELGIATFEIEESDGDSADGESYRAAGSYAFKVYDKHIQIDSLLRYEDGEGHVTFFGFGGHFGYRDETRGLLGVDTAFTRLTSSDQITASFYRFGLEGEYFLDRLTIGGAAGFMHGTAKDEDEKTSDELIYFKALARYYIRDDLKIEGSYGRVDPDDADGHLDYTHVMLEYGVPNRPMTVYGRWNGLFVDAGDGDEIDTHEFMLGVTLSLSGARDNSIKTNDRRYFTDGCLFENVASIC